MLPRNSWRAVSDAGMLIRVGGISRDAAGWPLKSGTVPPLFSSLLSKPIHTENQITHRGSSLTLSMELLYVSMASSLI